MGIAGDIAGILAGSAGVAGFVGGAARQADDITASPIWEGEGR